MASTIMALPAAYAEQLAKCSLAVDEQTLEGCNGTLTTTAVKDLRESPQKPPTPPPEPVIGQVKVRYSHYCKSFTVTDGVLQFGPIDSEYCISFVFKGTFGARLALEEPGGGRVPKLADGAEPIWAGPLSREEDEEGDTVVVGTFGGVEPEQTYQLFIEEDEGAEAAARAAGVRVRLRAKWE